MHSLTPRCCLRVCTPMPLSRPRWSLHRPGAGPGGGFRDEDAASSAGQPPQAGALTTCGAAGSASRKRVPGCGAGGRGPGWSHRDWALQAAAAPARAPVVSRAPRCCPRLLDGSRDSTQLLRNVTVPAGHLRRRLPRHVLARNGRAASTTLLGRVITCHRFVAAGTERSRAGPVGANQRRRPLLHRDGTKHVAALEWATVRERLTYRTCHMPNAP